MTIPPIHVCSGLEGAAPVDLSWSWPIGVPSAKTSVRVAWSAHELLVRAELEDADVVTKATADNQRFWELGDVFEIFLEAEGAGFYTEMHVAPGNHRLHLRIRPPEFQAMKEKSLALSDLIVDPPAFASRYEKTADGWIAEARIPAAQVDPKGVITRDSRWRASFCRYDAWSDGRPPVLSSTSPHPHAAFHRREEWRPLCF
jgi:hypothetical protein